MTDVRCDRFFLSSGCLRARLSRKPEHENLHIELENGTKRFEKAPLFQLNFSVSVFDYDMPVPVTLNGQYVKHSGLIM